MNKSFFLPCVALCLGLLAVAGFAPLEWYPLVPLSLAALYFLLQRSRSGRGGAALGFAWGMGCFLGGVSWVYVSMHDVGDMAAPLAGLATVLFCTLLAIFPACVMALFRRWQRGAWVDVFLFAGLWTLGEVLRGTVLTGFPWLAVGYAQTPPSPLAGYAPLLGVYGVSFVSALLAATGVRIFLDGRWLTRGLLLVGGVAVIAGGAALSDVAWTEAEGKPLDVSLLQGNIPQQLKWDPANLNLSFETYLRLTREHPADLVILPETAIPLLFDQIPGEVLDELTRRGPIVLGAALRVDGDHYINGAVALMPRKDGVAVPLQSYAKHHLVPFGEYIPPGFDWFFQLVNIPMNGFSVGPRHQEPLLVAGQRLMPNICYEDLFGEELIGGAADASILVNLSNTAWFGHSLAQPQHLQIARMRALETGRPMLRSTNTGMTAAITPRGELMGVLEPFAAGALRVNVQGTTGLTPYVRYGNLAALMLAALAMLPSVLSGMRQRHYARH